MSWIAYAPMIQRTWAPHFNESTGNLYFLEDWNPFPAVLSVDFSSLNAAAIFSIVTTTVVVDLNNIISY